MKKIILVLIASAAVIGCSGTAQEKDYRAEMLKLIESDFKSKGPVNVEQYMQQDDVQKFCSSLEGQKATLEELSKIRDSQLKTVKYPTDGNYLGDWKVGNEIANNGKGGQFSDAVGTVSGGNCYGCRHPYLVQAGSKFRGN